MRGRRGAGIRVVNLHSKHRINDRAAQNAATDILRIINKESAADLEIIFMDDKSIRQYNKKYLHKDRTTDVLSFKIDRREFGRDVFLAEIMISLDAALKNSKLYGTDFASEVALYMIHGILHLFGYDDGTAGDSRKMAGKQKRILDKLCGSRNLSEVLTPR